MSMCLQDNAFNYDKGVLAEILEPIMGKGLIPADLETWKPRRRAIVPAFHKAWLEAMVAMFGACTQETIRSLDALTASGQVLPFLKWDHSPKCFDASSTCTAVRSGSLEIDMLHRHRLTWRRCS